MCGELEKSYSANADSLVECSIKQVNWGKDWLIKAENPGVIRSSKD